MFNHHRSITVDRLVQGMIRGHGRTFSEPNAGIARPVPGNVAELSAAAGKITRLNKSTLALAAIAVIMLLSILAVAPMVAFADAGPHGSCVGLEASNISPAGSSDEFPGGMPDLKAFVNGAFPGVPYGVVISTIAPLHLGSHAECE